MDFKQFFEMYWGNIGAGILPISQDTKKILIAMRSPYVDQPGTYNVIGGKVDDASLPINIEAQREFEEETGYSGTMQLVPAYVFKDATHNFTYHNFIGLVPHEFQPKTNWETSFFEWLTLDELVKLQPKHFGLKALMTHSLPLIKKYAQ